MQGGELTLRPSAARLLESMRDIGYSSESALADIVDNSISAAATEVRIINDLDVDGHPYLAIMDNGRGMCADELTAAMRHGSRSPREAREAGDLGRFGLGMKTASFSQCRRLTVASRVAGRWEARCWDLDHIVEHDEWLLQVLDRDAISRLPALDSFSGNGTMILWQKLDRLDALGPHPDQIYEALNVMFGTARRHLALTFHRFVAPEPSDDLTRVSISINGAVLEALDPFARLMQPQSDPHELERLRMGNGEIVVQAFTLPHHQRLTAAQLQHLELGSSLAETQGLYIYRAKRLISGGTWLGMARRSELSKLLRVRVDVPTSLDAEWSVDVRKSRVWPPAVVRSRLRPLVERMTKNAQRPYTWRGTREARGSGMPLWQRVSERGAIRYEINREHPLVRHAEVRGEDSADLDALLLAIESTLPLDSLFADVGANPHGVQQSSLDAARIEQLLAAFVEAVAPGSDSIPAATAEAILQTPVFAGNPEARALLSRLRRIEP
ncbi:ATP-binding protein [Luteimonas sp. Y-2-2-4F]|nr:ATP-binding protein [Luteimonas sp. Y-2-2-4F]MCD9030869.1 ATP-binding protein [Luteimonas sp. Y-2-2-4F]